MAGPRFPAGQRQAGDRSHRSQRLTAKTERCHPFKIVQRGQFRRGVTRQRQCQLLPGDAATVVGHPDQLDPALFQLNLQGVATRIKRVFQQFLEHRSRTFHHLARRNLADQQVGQQADDGGRTRLGRHGADYTGREGREKGEGRRVRRCVFSAFAWQKRRLFLHTIAARRFYPSPFPLLPSRHPLPYISSVSTTRFATYPPTTRKTNSPEASSSGLAPASRTAPTWVRRPSAPMAAARMKVSN